MIEAARDPKFVKLFHVYNLHLLKKSFHHIGLSKTSIHPDRIPDSSLFLINHSSWWDPLLLFYVNEVWLKKDGIAMMDQNGLERFPFFRKLGAYSIDASNRRAILTSLKYTARKLDQGTSVFLFPQGKETHIDQRPLDFMPGASFIQEKSPHVKVVPISFYHHFFHHQRPEWFVHIGEPLSFRPDLSKTERTAYYEERMTAQLDVLKETAMDNDDDAFVTLLRGKPGVGDRLETFTSAVKRRLNQ
ncbi:lysophospholipid acyltransferase family protein [Salisediminibacterium selenitireducens]|uniref:Phospholipid/glycerol acyltransferase n=1 Tax=Bacillus selenitireducens (strain ATCC 700615 / DSM 15326 / MLS10) TaxID=439292 RepID=D6XVH6_BACIE|nr:lysophospholipid acyltransferase family protein [Salisediminibacterium selenitireducens]ADH99714.1 phospholipid/glycerol acyltransferase [[Bacillus] selenitireducens MLS10]